MTFLTNTRGMSRITLVAVLIVAAVVGCNRTGVTAGSLAGTWIMTDHSREHLPTALQTASARIILDPNETFVASNMPLDGMTSTDPERVELATGSGAWKLVSREGRSEIQLDFQLITENKQQHSFGTQVYISKFWNKTGLFYFLGDPDQGQRIEFEKK
jgi:hypothetical protein